MPLFPRKDEPQPLPYTPNAAGQRLFRVTHRNIDQQTAIYIADDPEGAVADDAKMVTVLGRELTHEVVECVELLPHGPVYHAPGEKVV